MNVTIHIIDIKTLFYDERKRVIVIHAYNIILEAEYGSYHIQTSGNRLYLKERELICLRSLLSAKK